MSLVPAHKPDTTNPVTSEEFNELMGRCGPFEPAPHLAVAVSGGSDSMALTLLAADWARARGGSVTALTIDHGLRPEAQAEAEQVGGWLKGRGIDHQLLRWIGIKPKTGIQAAARRARFDLLSGWCRGHGVLHLLLGHQREDQAETYMIREARDSGPDGLACMSMVSESPWVRLLRPCLSVPRARLRGLLEQRDQPWIDDPSNLNPAFARVRARADLATPHGDDGAIDRLYATTRNRGGDRRVRDGETARLLGRAASIHPAGYCSFDSDLITAAPEEIGRRALSRIVTCIGAQDYGPRQERLDRLYRTLRDDGLPHPRTLSGCVVARRRGRVLVAREVAAAAPETTLKPGVETIWDGRFRVKSDRKGAQNRHISIGPLGRDGWTGLTAIFPDARKSLIPPLVRPSLPAFRDKDGLLSAPHMGYYRDQTSADPLKSLDLCFFPGNALFLGAFPVV